MHNSCGEIFSGFCRNLVRISESIWTTCFEINDFEAHSFPIFQRSSWQWQRAWGRWHGQGRGTEGGGEGVGQISVKIILTAFCMHLTLFNQVQVDVHIEFCYIFIWWCGRSKWCKCVYVFHLLINKSVFTVYRYLYNEWMFDRCNFLMFQCK